MGVFPVEVVILQLFYMVMCASVMYFYVSGFGATIKTSHLESYLLQTLFPLIKFC